MNLTGTHINYYRLCKRKLWLFATGIQMEHTSDLVYDGKVIEAESYSDRSSQYEQLELSFDWGDLTLVGKIDFYDRHEGVIHETKRSNKVEEAHIWQVKFYLWLLLLNEIPASKGIIEYPKMREREIVYLEEKDVEYLKALTAEIQALLNSEKCPPVLNARICKSCSYYDFCYIME